MLSRVTRGRIVQRFAQSIFASTRGGVSQASRTVRIISVLPNAVMSFQIGPNSSESILLSNRDGESNFVTTKAGYCFVF